MIQHTDLMDYDSFEIHSNDDEIDQLPDVAMGKNVGDQNDDTIVLRSFQNKQHQNFLVGLCTG